MGGAAMSELFSGAGKRVRVMVMQGSALFGFLRGLDGRAAYRLYGMPADTKLIGTTISGVAPGCVAFLLESQEWEPLEANASNIPEVKFEILTAVMPPGMRVEKLPPKPAHANGAALWKLE
jgi:hypothetical protein